MVSSVIRTRRNAALALLFVLSGLPLWTQALVSDDSSRIPVVSSFSGSPLLLDVSVPDPEGTLRAVTFRTDVSTIDYRVHADPERDALRLYVSPFLASGVHELEIVADHGSRGSVENRLRVGFVDFVWGRDNLSFGNNSQYTSVIGTFGEILETWLDERFGEIPAADRILLIDYMYSLFGRNTGRCYAFAGTEVRYWRRPELLPTYYDSVHDLSGAVSRYQREMNYLQFDIVFDHFLAGPGAAQIARPMSRDELSDQALEIERRISSGEPVAVGFAGPDLHHSMLVFGFVRDPGNETFDLLVANNWKSDEKLNIHSRDAEIIRISLGPDLDGPMVQWRYSDGVRDREIDRLFVVDVRRGRYVHDRAHLDTLVAQLTETVRAGDRTIVVVEEADAALVTDGELVTGLVRNRARTELEAVWYERIGRAHRFSCEPHVDLILEVTDDSRARVLMLVPRDDGSFDAETRLAAAPASGETTVHRIEIARSGSAP